MQKILFILFISAIILSAPMARAAITDCKPGYKFNRNSGVGCQQINCADVEHAHYSYTGDCICGTAGSINEKPSDPNKACRYPNGYESCPGCVYACVHVNEACPDQAPVSAPQIQPEAVNPPALTVPVTEGGLFDSSMAEVTGFDDFQAQVSTSADAPINDGLGAVPPLLPDNDCIRFCAKLTRGGIYDEVLKAEGVYPDCRCTVDNKDDSNRLTQTVSQNGDLRTTYTYDPNTGLLMTKNTISIMAEKERIRALLGYKYNEEQIDVLLSNEAIGRWFEDKMSDIKTNASILTPAFWWQHIVALWDHGYGNSADFVDTYNFGRCGDSMEWLERNLAGELKLNGKRDKKSEAMLSVTGEKYGNILNHTALIVRPVGYSNLEWGEVVQELMDKTRGGGLNKNDLLNLDPRLLDAKVLDPYFKKTTTVREFIKGWSVIKIS